MSTHVIAVSRDAGYNFSKPAQDSILLIEGLGIEGDAHNGKTVKHRYRMEQVPTVPNLRQVHLIHGELFDEMRLLDFDIKPGEIGENILTRDIDLLGLPRGTVLQIGAARIEITGLRNPCHQLDDFMPGLMKAMIEKDSAGKPVFKSGIMGIVQAGGEIKAGDTIVTELPSEPHMPLQIV